MSSICRFVSVIFAVATLQHGILIAQQAPMEVIRVDEILSGKIGVLGKFGEPLGTPILGSFQISGNAMTDQLVEVETRKVRESKKLQFDVDPLFDLVKVHNHLNVSIANKGEFWFFEGMHSPGKPLNFPSGDVAQAKVGFFGHKSFLRIILRERANNLVPVKSPLKSERLVLAEDIEKGVCSVHGRLNSPLGKQLKGTITIVSLEAEDWFARVETPDNKFAKFAKSEIGLRRPGFGYIAGVEVLKGRERWTDMVFFENVSWSGIPKEFEGLGFDLSPEHEEFACRLQLVVCIP